MKRFVFLVLFLLLLCAWAPGLAAGAVFKAPENVPEDIREYFASSKFNGYTVDFHGYEEEAHMVNGAMHGYGFVVAQQGGHNVLFGFRNSTGKAWKNFMVSDSALPQGEGRFEIWQDNGAFGGSHGAVNGFRIIYQYPDNEEYWNWTLYIYGDSQGKWTVRGLSANGMGTEYSEAWIDETSVKFFFEGEAIGSAYGEVQNDLRYFSWSAFPRSFKEAKKKYTVAPDIPAGELKARQVKFTGGQKFDVYSGPGPQYFRSGDGRAAVSTNDWIQVFGQESGYLLIQYSVSGDQKRFGYIPASALPSNAKADRLPFSYQDAFVLADCFLTEDPLGEGGTQTVVNQGRLVTWLAAMGPWAYIETTLENNQPIRGFVLSSNLSRDAEYSELTDVFSDKEYTASAHANLFNGGGLITVDVSAPLSWMEGKDDPVTGYQVFANNLPLDAAVSQKTGYTVSGRYVYHFDIYVSDIPAAAAVLGLCPVRKTSGPAPRETITLRLGALASLPPQKEEDDLTAATVYNPDPNDRLHLRKAPYGSSTSLGKYYSGVRVKVLDGYDPDAEWTHVSVAGLEGYMMTQYLVFGNAGDQVPDAQPTVTVENAGGTGLNLRMSPSLDGKLLKLVPNGTRVTVLGVTQDWLHVLADEQFGFISANGVSPRLSYNYGVPGGKLMKARVLHDSSTYSRPFSPGEYVGDAGDPNGLITSTVSPGTIVTVYQIKSGFARISSSNWVSLDVLEWIEDE